jgi:hypothetical protein
MGVALDGRMACTTGPEPQMVLALQASEMLATKSRKKNAFRMHATINDKPGSVKFRLFALTIC